MASILQNLQMKLYNMAFKAQAATGGFLPYYVNPTPTWRDWDADAATKLGYKAAVHVYACINRKAKAAASIPWKAYKRKSDGTWEEIKNHPLEQLIERPTPFHSRTDLIERMVINLDLAGNSIFQKVKIGNATAELWPIGPQGITPIADQNEFIKAYEYKKGNSKWEIAPDEILHAMYIDPSNVYWGLAPLQVAARTVDTDIEAVNWNKVALQNRAVTDGVFSFDQPLTEEQWNQARQQVREQHQGSANARAPWVLGSGARWNQMSMSPADMDFLNGRKMTREEICSVFNVPPPIVGIMEHTNYSNMREARRVFWLDTIIPLLEDIKNVLNRSLAREHGEDIELDYDVSNVEALQENTNEKIEGAFKLWSMGIPFNEVNQRLDLGFDEIAGGDTGYLPANLLPAGFAAAVPAPKPPQNQPNDPPDPELIPDGDPNNDPAAVPEPVKRAPHIQNKGINLETTEQKAAYWKAFERSRFQWYKIIQKRAEELLLEEGKAVAAEYVKTGNARRALSQIDEEAWQDFLLKSYQEIVKQYGQDTFNNLKSGYGAAETKAFNPWDQNIILYLMTTAAQKVKQITKTTKTTINKLITDLRADGASIEEIGKELDTEFSNMSKYRAFRIARTEVVAASNFGSYSAALQASDSLGEMEKEWIDSADDRVRESHNEENGVAGEVRPLTEKFSNGLDYPGDSLNGTAAEVIQCRCTLAYKTKR